MGGAFFQRPGQKNWLYIKNWIYMQLNCIYCNLFCVECFMMRPAEGVFAVRQRTVGARKEIIHGLFDAG